MKKILYLLAATALAGTTYAQSVDLVRWVFRVFTTEEANEQFRLSYIRHLMV